MICPKCGNQIPDNVKECPNCGELLSSKPKKSSLPIGLIASVLVVLLIIGGYTYTKSREEAHYTEQLAIGKQAFESGNYTSAVEALSKAISIRPERSIKEDSNPYRMLAASYAETQDFKTAYKTYDTYFSLLLGHNETSASISDDAADTFLDAITYSASNGDMAYAEAYRKELMIMSGDDEKLKETVNAILDSFGRYQSYFDFLVKNKEKYGICSTKYVGPNWPYLSGLAFAKLVDFNLDGNDELLIAYEKNEPEEDCAPEYAIEVWTYENNQLTLVGNLGGYAGDGGTTSIYLRKKPDAIYAICGGADGFQFCKMYTLQNGRMEMTHSASCLEDGASKIDNNIVTYEEAEAHIEGWFDGAELYDLSRDEDGQLNTQKELLSTFHGLSVLAAHAHDIPASDIYSGAEEMPEPEVPETPDIEANSDYLEAYKEIVRDVYYEQNDKNAQYYLVDINKDDILELLIQVGTCEADYQYRVYTLKDGEVLLTGTIWGGHSLFYLDDIDQKQNYLVHEMAHMGYQIIYYTYMDEKGTITEEEISSGDFTDSNYAEIPNPIPHCSITDMSLFDHPFVTGEASSENDAQDASDPDSQSDQEETEDEEASEENK